MKGSPPAVAVAAADASNLVFVQTCVVDYTQVDVQSLDAQMVALYRKQNSLQAVLQRQRELCQQLTQVALHHTMTAYSARLLSHMLALPVTSNNNQKGKSTFFCHDKSLLRWLVGGLGSPV